MLSVAPLRMTVWRVSKALKTTCWGRGKTRRQLLAQPGTIAGAMTHNRIGFLEFGCEGLAHVVDRAVVRISGGDEGVQVLRREESGSVSVVNARAPLSCKPKRTLDFGGAAFGLHAPLTTLSKEDIVEDR